MVVLLAFNGAQQSRQRIDITRFLDISSIYALLKTDHIPLACLSTMRRCLHAKHRAYASPCGEERKV